MANEEKRLAEVNPEVDPDPLTGSRTVAQTPTPDDQITELPQTENADGENVRAGDFDETTGAAHPAEGSGADQGVDRKN